MKSIAIFMLFIGTILIIQGYYSNFYGSQTPQTIIKYIPSSVYNENMKTEKLDDYYKGLISKPQ